MQNGAVSYGRDIYESLAEYITDERYHQAVLLNGSWGSGKTCLSRKSLFPLLSKITRKTAGASFIFPYMG